MKFKTLRSIVRFVMNIIADIEVEGLENIPQGNILAASNHLGRLDTAALLCVVDREDIIMAVAEKYKNHFLFGAIGRAVNAIWLNRFEADFAALREILNRMQKGGLMVIAPEGTRSKTASLQEGKMGVAFLASKSGYPVVPVALTGTEDAGVIANLKKFRKSKIKIKVGKPLKIQISAGKGREEAMQKVTEEIMCQIAFMLPESYRGVYKDHPRTEELLNQN
ncbi:MAG: 1-acyl-sn-glycerol-3-phosphate acyltransferase [Anaerolineales bacterium]|nr:1-acyl-sn-glycerol-3-phosphate acyltransferase [Anaerolineales bacterium]